jgi:hypothetical protein
MREVEYRLVMAAIMAGSVSGVSDGRGSAVERWTEPVTAVGAQRRGGWSQLMMGHSEQGQ